MIIVEQQGLAESQRHQSNRAQDTTLQHRHRPNTELNRDD
jgi:hypothetical protein